MPRHFPSCQLTRMCASSQEMGLTASAMVLVAVLVAFTLACLPIALWVGNSGVAVLLSATGICVGSGVAALAISHYFMATGRQLVGMLLAMFCRLLPPLVVCLWLAMNKSAPESRVFAGFLIAAYLVSLAAETFLSIRSMPQAPQSVHSGNVERISS